MKLGECRKRELKQAREMLETKAHAMPNIFKCKYMPYKYWLVSLNIAGNLLETFIK